MCVAVQSLLLKKSLLSRISLGFRLNLANSPFGRPKHTVDKSKVPEVDESDLEENFVRGWGPGGQKVNKTASCVVLKHVPTGIVVKCQEHRVQRHNRTLARQILRDKLDQLINGEDSVAAQKRRIEAEQSKKQNQKARKLRELKTAFKEKEGLT